MRCPVNCDTHPHTHIPTQHTKGHPRSPYQHPPPKQTQNKQKQPQQQGTGESDGCVRETVCDARKEQTNEPVADRATHHHPEQHLQESCDGSEHQGKLGCECGDLTVELQHTQHAHQPQLLTMYPTTHHTTQGQRNVRLEEVMGHTTAGDARRTRRSDLRTLGADDHATLAEAPDLMKSWVSTQQVTRNAPQQKTTAHVV